MRLPGFGDIVHAGRRSGRTHRTPVLAFAQGDAVVIALTYGTATEWVQNVLHAGGCTFETRTVRLELTAPRLRHDRSRRLVPRAVRPALAPLRAADFLQLSVAKRHRIRPDT